MLGDVRGLRGRVPAPVWLRIRTGIRVRRAVRYDQASARSTVPELQGVPHE